MKMCDKLAISIINSTQNELNVLRNSKRTDKRVISLMLCEMYFRPRIERLAEYFFLPFIALLSKKRKLSITVGLGQIKVENWIKFIPSLKPYSVYSILIYERADKNYDLIANFLSEVGERSEIEIVKSYNGMARKFHVSLYTCIRNHL